MHTPDLALTVVSLGLALAVAPDARADLDAVAQAMGTSKVDSVQLSGSGHAYAVGQAFQPGQAWPKMNLVRYTRIDDYAKVAHSFDYAMTRAEVRGGGAIPQVGEARRTGGVSGINPATRNLWENIERLRLDVQTVLPIHGRMTKVDELKLEAGVQ
jgi:hypothetical protein